MTLLKALAVAITLSAATVHAGDDWTTDYEDALKESAKTGKPILANFTGSDWCGYCIKLDKEVFSTDTFEDWAEENVILLEVDFPRRKSLSKNSRGKTMSWHRSSASAVIPPSCSWIRMEPSSGAPVIFATQMRKVGQTMLDGLLQPI